MASIEKSENEIEPNTALLSAILMIGTFVIAYKLRAFKSGQFLGRSVSYNLDLNYTLAVITNPIFISFLNQARKALGDFGVPIAILIMFLVDYGISINGVKTEKLKYVLL